MTASEARQITRNKILSEDDSAYFNPILKSIEKAANQGKTSIAVDINLPYVTLLRLEELGYTYKCSRNLSFCTYYISWKDETD